MGWVARVSAEWLNREFGLLADEARYAIVEDDGMAARLCRGALVVLDARRTVYKGGIFLVEGEGLLARRLYKMPDGAFELTADAGPNWRYRAYRPNYRPCTALCGPAGNCKSALTNPWGFRHASCPPRLRRSRPGRVSGRR